MPWKETTHMSERTEFIEQAKREDVNISSLCRAFGISRKTGYKWLSRENEEGPFGLMDRSRRPHHSPCRTPAEMETQVLEIRKHHPAWGGRKIRKVLETQGEKCIPSPSTITAILHRHDQIDPQESPKHKPMQRFEREHPNELWQMDFKGDFALTEGGRCHPLTVIDDHSRFLVGLKACSNETRETVKAQLTAIFQQYGLPERLLMDNGRPWGFDRDAPHTRLTVWLLQLGIAVSHGRPYHPQTQGKDERFNRTLNIEVIQQHTFSNLLESQQIFDAWSPVYNFTRPHEALQLNTPSSRYAPSPRSFPSMLPPVTYSEEDIIRKIDLDGYLRFRGRVFRISKAFAHQPVALRPAEPDGIFQVFFCTHPIARISLRDDNDC